MQAISVRGLWAGLFAAGVLGAAAIAFTGSAAADQERAGGGGATIKMKLGEGGPSFAGSNEVESGKNLKIINKSDPMEIGPHTFSLVKRSLVDQGSEQRECGRLESRVCKDVLKAHRVGPPPDFKVGKAVVQAGKNGWDRRFNKKHKGDSWFSQEEGESHSRKVNADPGQTLYFFCLVHPDMQGAIEVTD